MKTFWAWIAKKLKPHLMALDPVPSVSQRAWVELSHDVEMLKKRVASLEATR